jgi:hypothetical protein
MAITTYAELQAAVASWLARGDLSASIPDFIALGEQRLFYGSDDPNFSSPPLRLRAMEAATDPASYKTEAGVTTLALPANFLEARSLSLATEPSGDLDLVGQKQLTALWTGGGNGRPLVYAFQGDALRFAPTPDAAYGVLLCYYKRFDPLSVTPTNWLLQNAPGVYLYAALLEAQPFLLNDARLAVWAAMLGAATRALQQSDARDRWGGQMTLRTDTGAP